MLVYKVALRAYKKGRYLPILPYIFDLKFKLNGIMSTKNFEKPSRRYFIDWLRIILILSVFIYHIGMYFNTWNWHIKNDLQVTWFNDTMRFLHLWRMPLLFLVSGIGTYYALGFRTVKQYLNERTRRIFIPFCIGLFTLVPVQVYIERADEFESLFHYYPYMFQGIYPTGNFSWHHLWFLIYLFLIALLISPFLKYFRSERFIQFKGKIIKYSIKPLGLNWVALLLIMSQAMLRPVFPNQTNALYNDWAYFVYYLIFFLVGFVLMTSKELIESIASQRRGYFTQTVLATFLFFLVDSNITNTELYHWLNGITGVIVAWSISVTVLGYCKVYLNKDSKWRKVANEAIYPFYLLHQPVIVIIGYFLASWEVSIIYKMLLFTIITFLITVLIYWLLIRPYNLLRLTFGLKVKQIKELKVILN